MSVNLTTLVCQTIERDAVIRQGIARGLIGPRALAYHIVKSNPSMNLSLEAVRTAIRRSQKELTTLEERQNRTYQYLRETKVHLKSGVVKVSFQKGDASLELINRSFKAMEIYGGDTFRVVKGHKILHILLDEENLEKIKTVFSERILNIEPNLCELTAALPESAYKIPGLFSAIINEIGINEINILEAFSSKSEINFFLDDKDSQHAFNVIKEMIERAKKEYKEATSKK